MDPKPLYTRIVYINGRPQPEGGTGGGGGPATGLFDWRESVLDRIATPPGLPAVGDRYLITAPATGAWAGHEDEIAQWTGSAWTFEVPDPGFATYVEDEDIVYFYDGAVWSAAAFSDLGWRRHFLVMGG